MKDGCFAYEGLERALHERARLGIMTALVTRADGSTFNDLKRLCVLTDGNLSRHLDVLREAGVVEILKGTRGGRPQTVCRVTADGRRRFRAYLDELSRVVRRALPKAAAKSGRPKDLPGFISAP
jgi:DNA-binding transcriptional ArsR family regulator